MSRLTRCAGAVLMVGAALTASLAQSAPRPNAPRPIGTALNVVQPGQSGDPASPHHADQLDLYRNWQFKPMSLNPPAGAKTETPKAGVTIYRDDYGVPYVVSATDAGTAYGAGWAEAEDRFMQMDVLRHQVEGRLAELLPPSQLTPQQQAELVDGDVASRANDATDADLAAQLAKQPGIQQTMMRTYADGINDWLKKAQKDGSLPVEYVLLGQPDAWRVTDSLHIAAYMSHTFGLAGGQELRTAELLRSLRLKFPKSKTQADAYFGDIVWRTDPASPTTIPIGERTFTYPTGGAAGIAGAGVALPTGAVKQTAPAHGNGPYDLDVRHLASNEIVVSKTLSLTKHNLLMGGPQMGQYDPQIVVELALHGATIRSRGVTFPGAGPVVLIGRTRNHAWTFTTGADDQTDTWAHELNPANPEQYRYNGAWETFAKRTETIRRRTATGTEVAKTVTLQVAGHGHGQVVATGTVGGKKVAFTRGYTFRGQELRIFSTIWELNRDTGIAAIRGTLPGFPAAFNLAYADGDRIAYYHLGWFPVRATDTDDRLPTWGNGAHEWRGLVPFAKMPQITNPKQGWLANWNNKPVAGWGDGDSTPWGSQQRVSMLQDQLTGAKNVTLTKLRRVIQNAAYLDGRVKLFRAAVLDAVDRSTNPLVQDAADALGAWDGMRIDRDGNGLYDSAGVAILDRWWTEVQGDVLRNTIGQPAFDLAGDTTFDRDFWGSDRASLLLHVLRGRASSVPLRGTWPTGPVLKDLMLKAFIDTATALKDQYGTSDVTRWLAARDTFTYTPFSTLLTPPADVPHMNRGTYNQLIELG
jgi:penicillin amidase